MRERKIARRKKVSKRAKKYVKDRGPKNTRISMKLR